MELASQASPVSGGETGAPPPFAPPPPALSSKVLSWMAALPVLQMAPPSKNPELLTKVLVRTVSVPLL